MPRTLMVFSDGTGQIGVQEADPVAGQTHFTTETNIYRMYVAGQLADISTIEQLCFYDPGLGSNEFGGVTRLLAKATGWGISRNIADCYQFILANYQPGDRLAFFGFSRGAYTVRSLGGVLSNCGIAATDAGGRSLQTGDDAKRRHRDVAEAAVAAYQTSDDFDRETKSQAFRNTHGSVEEVPFLIGVFDTVRALGLPGILDIANVWNHKFHDDTLNPRTAFGLQALAVDENRKIFAPVTWDESGKPDGQVIEQVWFPGVHSDIGGGYLERGLADIALKWMVERCREPDIGLKFHEETLALNPSITGVQHDERAGWKRFRWRKGERGAFVRNNRIDDSRLTDDIERRFDEVMLGYRPNALSRHPRVRNYYD